ncbi:MAG: hypothetical protein Kapaf2KO_13730 [Candidatus Kapaibacteriales bacterium]
MKIALLLLLVFPYSIYSQLCSDFVALDGSEQVVSFGMDTTTNWWAVTSPYQDRFRLNVNGEETEAMLEVLVPTFSPDSERWAAFIRDQTGWFVIDEADFYPINTQQVGTIVYSNDSQGMAYSYLVGDIEYIYMPDTTIAIQNKSGQHFLGWEGKDIFYKLQLGEMQVAKTLDWESEAYQQIELVGFWHDGDPIYFAFSGVDWTLFKRDESISEEFLNITDPTINLAGDVVAFGAQRRSGRMIAAMYTEEFADLYRGKEYDAVSDIVLHPHEPIMAFIAKFREQVFVVTNETEGWGGDNVGVPFFSHDGEEVSYMGCNVNCYLIINGQRNAFGMQMNMDFDYAVAPGTKTIAFASGAGLNVVNLDQGGMSLGRMMDFAQGIRYNWRVGKYQSLGMINRTLFFLECLPG